MTNRFLVQCGVAAVTLVMFGYVNLRSVNRLMQCPPPHMFDPYGQQPGMRNLPYGMYEVGERESLLVDPTLKPLPRGIRVTLVKPDSKGTIAGPPGRIEDNARSAAQLREALRALLAFEEAGQKVGGDPVVMDYDKAPWIPGRSDFQGRPVYIGWHVVEISNGRNNFRAVLPDKRFAKDLARYNECMEERLIWLSDTKFFSSQKPGHMPKGARRIYPRVKVPDGLAFHVVGQNGAVWAIGGKLGTQPPPDRKVLEKQIEAALQSFLDEVSQKQLIPPVEVKANGKLDNGVGVTVVYPGGETYTPWTLKDDPDFPPHYTYETVRMRPVRESPEDAAAAIIRYLGPPPNRGSISYGKVKPPAGG